MTMLNGEPIETPNISTAPTPPVAPSSDADASMSRIMGLIGILVAFLFPPAGIVIGAISMRQAKRAGQPNTLGKVGMLTGLILTVLIVVGLAVLGAFMYFTFRDLFAICEQLGTGEHVKDGITYKCNV